MNGKTTKTGAPEYAAALLVRMHNHPDVAEMRQRFDAQLGQGEDRWTLEGFVPLEADVPGPKLMETPMKIGLGLYIAGFGCLVLGLMPWAWSTASRVAEGKQDAVRLFGIAFTATPEFWTSLIVILMALVGCFAILAMTFASRAGHGTLEATYLWWYLTRPISAAGIGMLAYLAIAAGFLTANSAAGRSSLAVAAAIGGFAGLFTDQVLKKMRSVFAITPTAELGSKSTGND